MKFITNSVLCTLLAFFSTHLHAFGSSPPSNGGGTPTIPAPKPKPKPEPKPDPIPAPNPKQPSVTGFMLYDEAASKDIAALKSGSIVNLANVTSNMSLNIRAVVNDLTHSVEFSMDSLAKRTEKSAPFTVFEENGSGKTYLSKNGIYRVTARAVDGQSLSLVFYIRGADAEEPLPEEPKPEEPKPEDPAPPSNYDPKKDAAYNGYKYRPGEGYTVKKYKLPPKPSCIKEVTSTITVTGTFDGQGCLYTFKGKGEGKSYKDICFAPKEISEGMPAMFDLKHGATIKNLQIECALDGIHTSKNNTIDNVFFRDVEEDAITANENITIKNSQFWFCNDKCIQMNRANKVTITNNKFFYASSAILANYGRNVEAKGNYFYETKRAIRSRTKDSTVVAENNTHENGDCHLMAQDKGILEDWGGNKTTGVKKKHCTENGGRIVEK